MNQKYKVFFISLIAVLALLAAAFIFWKAAEPDSTQNAEMSSAAQTEQQSVSAGQTQEQKITDCRKEKGTVLEKYLPLSSIQAAVFSGTITLPNNYYKFPDLSVSTADSTKTIDSSPIRPDGSFCLVGNKVRTVQVNVSAGNRIILSAIITPPSYDKPLAIDAKSTAVSRLALNFSGLWEIQNNSDKIIGLAGTLPEAQAYTKAITGQLSDAGPIDLSALDSKNENADLKKKALDAISANIDITPHDSAYEAGQRDKTRIADIRQLSTALDLYFNDQGGYPSKLNDLAPTYVRAVPIAPTPTDGTCTAFQNNYTYNPSGTGWTGPLGHTVYTKYTLTFCFGSVVGGYSMGTHTLSPTGIN